MFRFRYEQFLRVMRRHKMWRKNVAVGAVTVLLSLMTFVSMTGVLLFDDCTIITADGVTRKFFSKGELSNPEAILSEHGYCVDEFDVVVVKGNTITVIRGDDVFIPSEGSTFIVNGVEFRERVYTEAIAYDTVYEQSKLVALNDTVVTTKGVNGEMKFVFREKLVDGEVVASEVLYSGVTAEPVTEVVSSGLALHTPMSKRDFPEIRLENGLPVDYVKKISGRATAYTAPANARTATGRPLLIGTVAVDPRKIPYGSLLYIVSSCGNYVYGAAIAADTGGFISHGNGVIADLYMGTTSPSTLKDAFGWGVRGIDIYVINTGIY
ncbi:MAG: G5 domain-containing protein [Oscillospiraceae bacterium]|nr:G5 domain-containing protein [Oscillospiraceae bacterium]